MAQGGISYLKNEFASQYGNYADKFPLVNAYGESAKFNIALIVFFIMFFTTAITGSKVFPPKNEKEKSNDKTLKMLFKILFVLCILGLVSSGFMGLVNHMKFSSQYWQWYRTLPGAAKMKLASIKDISSALAAATRPKQ